MSDDFYSNVASTANADNARQYRGVFSYTEPYAPSQPDDAEATPNTPDCMPNAPEHSTAENAALTALHPALSHYTNLQKIGAGSQGTMLRAIASDGSQVAIKVFDIQKTDSLKSLELFEREIDTLKNINVSGVPKFIEDIRTDRYLYLVEEYIDAPSLEKRVQTGQRFTFEQVLTILKNAAQILQDLGDLIPPVVHRDIKPANLLVDDACHVALVDFGVVAAKDQSSFAMTFAGTAGYLAPEQLYGKATTASDIFSLGVTIAQLVTGKAPCDMNMDGLKLNIHKYIPSNIPKWFVLVLDQMINPNTSDRLQNGRQVLLALQSEQKAEDSAKTHDTHSPSALPGVTPSDASPQNQDTQSDAASKLFMDIPNKINKIYDSLEEICSEYHFTILWIPIFLALLSFPIYWIFGMVIFGFPASVFLTEWLPGIYPFIIGLAGCASGGACLSDEEFRIKINEFKSDALKLNKVYAEALLHPENGNHDTLPNFKDITDARDFNSDMLLPLSSYDNEKLDDYIKRSQNIIPCLAFKPHTGNVPISQYIKSILFTLLSIAIIIAIIIYSKLSMTWTVISIIIYAISFIAHFKYFRFIFKTHIKRISDPEYIEAYQLYLRRFIYEYHTPQFTANPDDPQTPPAEQPPAPQN